MTVSLEDMMKKFTPEQRLQVEARTAELVEEELTLRDLRQAQHLTQERMAELMGVEQENVSRLERRADLLLSTLSSYVAAMGGKLRLVAEFRTGIRWRSRWPTSPERRRSSRAVVAARARRPADQQIHPSCDGGR
jgi:DNA-binding XRE family transcriptional regulator